MTKEADELIGKYFPVLDEGFVALVDYMGDDSSIEQAARVSYGAGTRAVSDTRHLLRHLFRHRHTTPYETVQLKFHVKLPIFVARQLIRHRTFSTNEYSMRYSLAPLQFYMPEFENFAKQSKSNRQGRGAQADRELYDRLRGLCESIYKDSSEVYVESIVEDVARELARVHLPLSLYTEWYVSMNLHNLLHFLGLRADPHAQWEAQQYAKVKAGIVKVLAPIAFEAWIDYAHCATQLSRIEWNIVRWMLTRAEDEGRRHIWGSSTKLSEEDLTSFGLSRREVDEFLVKFESVQPVPVPDFDLDLGSAKSAEYFLERAQAATPSSKKT